MLITQSLILCVCAYHAVTDFVRVCVTQLPPDMSDGHSNAQVLRLFYTSLLLGNGSLLPRMQVSFDMSDGHSNAQVFVLGSLSYQEIGLSYQEIGLSYQEVGLSYQELGLSYQELRLIFSFTRKYVSFARKLLK